jgi:hypothetical protein
MAAPYNPPVKGEEFKVRIGLRLRSTTYRLAASPTIAAGDFKIDKDGAGFNDLATLPTVSPAGGKAVLIELSATEMNCDVATILCSDQTDPPEWSDFMFSIPTTS